MEEINAKEKRVQSRGRPRLWLRLRLLSSSSFVSLVDNEKTTLFSRAQLERSINHLSVREKDTKSWSSVEKERESRRPEK